MIETEERPVRYSFKEAFEALEEGKRIATEAMTWTGTFIFKQVPSEISIDIIPKMQSLPQFVKDEFIRRGRSITYNDQYCVVYPGNTINGWRFSHKDEEGEWCILD